MAIAQAAIEYIHENIGKLFCYFHFYFFAKGCRTLLATHFHQLVSLAEVHAKIGCYQATIGSSNEHMLLTHKIEVTIQTTSNFMRYFDWV